MELYEKPKPKNFGFSGETAKKEAARPIIHQGKPNNPGGISVGPPCLATGQI